VDPAYSAALCLGATSVERDRQRSNERTALWPHPAARFLTPHSRRSVTRVRARAAPWSTRALPRRPRVCHLLCRAGATHRACLCRVFFVFLSLSLVPWVGLRERGRERRRAVHCCLEACGRYEFPPSRLLSSLLGNSSLSFCRSHPALFVPPATPPCPYSIPLSPIASWRRPCCLPNANVRRCRRRRR